MTSGTVPRFGLGEAVRFSTSILWKKPQLAAFVFLLAAFQAFAQAPTVEENYNQGRVLESAGRMTEATPYYDEVVRMSMAEISHNAATAETYVFLTRALRRLGRHAETISWGWRGMQAFPREYRLLETMGQSYFYLGNMGESLAYMERYANLMPNGENISLAYFFMAEVFRVTGRFYRADMAYTMALRFAPGMALWWYRLGAVREEIDDLSGAREAYIKALEINPNYGVARSAVGRLDGD